MSFLLVPSGSGTYAPAASADTNIDRNDYTAGNISLNSTSWADVPSLADLVIDAAAGDWIEFGLSARWGAEAVNGYLDVATIVSGSPVNYVSGLSGGASEEGVVAWFSFSGENTRVGPSIVYQVQAGDVSGGQVTLRLRYRTASATTKSLLNSATRPLTTWARNLG